MRGPIIGGGCVGRSVLRSRGRRAIAVDRERTGMALATAP
ncbi:hypothetical protein BBAL3_2629 [Brevundimonas sp. BAL3]|nr:hypothetical protein BBAL3_2629 [Brevundimonas sp. BAL3]